MSKSFLPTIARARAFHRYCSGRFYFKIPDPGGDYWDSLPADPLGVTMLVQSLMDGPPLDAFEHCGPSSPLAPYKFTAEDALDAVRLLYTNPDPEPPEPRVPPGSD